MKIIWLKYYIGSLIQRYWNTLMVVSKVNKLIITKFKKEKISADDAAQRIIESIEKSKPIMVSRFGCFESRCLGEGFGIEYGCLRSFTKTALNPIFNNAVVFPYGNEGAQRFFDITKEAIKDIDLLGVWSTEMHDYLVDEKCPKEMEITDLNNLEPFRNKNPWSKALAGKRVVVIHLFSESIQTQYWKRMDLFDNPDILPQFNLRVVKAVQTIAGEIDDRFSNWEEALMYMYEECMKEDFDVAIIGCGAYGMPLASMIKKAGKAAIHLGGSTQILFGIKGSRWDDSIIASMYNEHWVRPSNSETPQNSRNVEKGCYW